MLSWEKRGKYCSWNNQMKFICVWLEILVNGLLFVATNFGFSVAEFYRFFETSIWQFGWAKEKITKHFKAYIKRRLKRKEKNCNFFSVLKMKSKILLNKWFSKCYFWHANKIWKKWRKKRKMKNCGKKSQRTFACDSQSPHDSPIHSKANVNSWKIECCMISFALKYVCMEIEWIFCVIVRRCCCWPCGKMVSVMSQVIFWLNKKNFFFEFSIEKLVRLKFGFAYIAFFCNRFASIFFLSIFFSKCHWCVNGWIKFRPKARWWKRKQQLHNVNRRTHENRSTEQQRWGEIIAQIVTIWNCVMPSKATLEL